MPEPPERLPAGGRAPLAVHRSRRSAEGERRQLSGLPGPSTSPAAIRRPAPALPPASEELPRRQSPAPGRSRLPRLLSVRAVADQTTLPISTVYDAIYRGDLPVVRIGRSVRLDERDIVDFIAARKEHRP